MIPFVDAVKSHGDRPALITTEGVTTYRELSEEVDTIARALRPDEGRRLALVGIRNRPAAVAAYLGTLAAGHAVLLVDGDDSAVIDSMVEAYDPDVTLLPRASGSASWTISEPAAGHCAPRPGATRSLPPSRRAHLTQAASRGAGERAGRPAALNRAPRVGATLVRCALGPRSVVGRDLVRLGSLGTHSPRGGCEMLRTRSLSAVAVIGAIGLLVIAQATMVSAKGPAILEWDTMVGVPAGLTGAQSQAPLRGINGGGIAWTLASGRGELSVDGDLEIEVDGLVLAAGANAGNNPSATFRGLVSCVKGDGTFQNILTDPFPATTGPATAGGGDSKIEATVALPSPCIAPIVFVTSAGGSWFAATGN